MNRRQRWIIHAVLGIVAGLLAWRLGTEWRQADLRYSALASQTEQRAAVLPAAVPEEPLAADEIAAKNLFSADRNNELPPPETESSEAGPAPPPPAVLGTMKLGEDYEALMSEGESSRDVVRRVKQGDQIGEYRVTEIRDEKVVVEYQGQTTTLDIYQSARSVSRQRTPAGPAAPVVVGTGGGQPAGRSRTPPARAQRAAPRRPMEPGVRVSVEGNRRRLERDTPFGTQIWYEPLEQGTESGEQGTGNRQ